MLQWTRYMLGLHASFQVSVSFSSAKYAEVESLAHMVVLFLIFLFNFYTYFPWWLHWFTFTPTVHKGSFFSTTSPTLVISCLFENSHSDKCEVISHCGFDLHLTDDSDVEHRFTYLWVISVSSLENVIQILFPFCNQIVCFCCWVVWVPYIFWILTPY